MAYRCTVCGKKLIERFRLEDKFHTVYILYECKRHGFVDIAGKYYTRNADAEYDNNVDLFAKCDKYEKRYKSTIRNKIFSNNKTEILFGIVLTFSIVGIMMLICMLLKLIEFISWMM